MNDSEEEAHSLIDRSRSPVLDRMRNSDGQEQRRRLSASLRLVDDDNDKLEAMLSPKRSSSASPVAAAVTVASDATTDVVSNISTSSVNDSAASARPSNAVDVDEQGADANEKPPAASKTPIPNRKSVQNSPILSVVADSTSNKNERSDDTGARELLDEKELKVLRR